MTDAIKPALRRLRRARYTAPMAAYAAVHLTLLLAIWFILSQRQVNLPTALEGGDGGWYANIAEHWYPRQVAHNPDGTVAQSNIAFFPLMPMLMSAVATVTGTAPIIAGLIVTALADLAAAAGIYALVSRRDRDLAFWTVLLWAAVPAAFIQWMAYGEALYTALAAWCLYALVRRKWLTAAALCLLAGLAHSTAAALVCAVCLAGLVSVIRTRGPEQWRALAAILIAPLGLVGYLGYIGLRTGDLRAWFQVENAPGWQGGFDFGRQTYQLLRWAESTGNRGDRNELLLDIVLLLLLVTALLLAVLLRGRALPWEVALWTAVSVLMVVLTSGPYSAKPRYLLPFFPLLVPVASVLIRTGRFNRVLVYAALLALSGWWGGYFLAATGVAL